MLGMFGVDFLNFVLVWFLKKKLGFGSEWVQNEFGLVRFEKCSSDIIVIYYFCNS